MLKKYDADELKPYAEKLKQMAIDKLVSTFDVSDISFQSLTTSSGIGDATTHTLLCPNCHNQFTVTLNSDRYSYPSPICPHCGFSHGHAGASRGSHISMYSDKLKVSLENDIYALREGNVIIAGTCDANANFVDNGTAYELIPDNANIFSIIAFGPEKAVYFKFEGENELKKMKYDKHGETYFTSYRARWGAPYRPIHPEIKSWMDDMGFKDYSAVLDFYKSKRKVPTFVKPTIDPAAFREYSRTKWLYSSLMSMMQSGRSRKRSTTVNTVRMSSWLKKIPTGMLTDTADMADIATLPVRAAETRTSILSVLLLTRQNRLEPLLCSRSTMTLSSPTVLSAGFIRCLLR